VKISLLLLFFLAVAKEKQTQKKRLTSLEQGKYLWGEGAL